MLFRSEERRGKKREVAFTWAWRSATVSAAGALVTIFSLNRLDSHSYPQLCCCHSDHGCVLCLLQLWVFSLFCTCITDSVWVRVSVCVDSNCHFLPGHLLAAAVCSRVRSLLNNCVQLRPTNCYTHTHRHRHTQTHRETHTQTQRQDRKSTRLNSSH